MKEPLDPTVRSDHQARGPAGLYLPSLPAVVQELLAVIQSGTATAAEVGKLLSSEPALVAQVLKIVNSAYYGLPRPIAEVKHAVAYLGLSEIERLALTATVMQQFAPSDRRQLEGFWRHSFHTALVSKVLVRELPTSFESGTVHTAALLHDVGKLVFIKIYPEQYTELVAHCESTGCLAIDGERALGLPSHVELGSALCDHWRLPHCVALACRHHELADLRSLNDESELHDEILVVCLANVLTNLAGEELSAATKQALQSAAMQALDRNHDEFLMLMGRVYELKTEVETFLASL